MPFKQKAAKKGPEKKPSDTIEQGRVNFLY